jgi:peptide subunit release factor 1 (eRF1)
VSECFFSKEEKESSNKEMNALDTFEEKAASSEDVSAQFKSGSKIEIISTTLW